MKILIAVEEQGGLMFHNRRVSQDVTLREKIKEITKNQKVWMNAYSQKQFEGMDMDICTDEEFMEKAAMEDFCFVETFDIAKDYEKIQEVVLFRWNRKYPSDIKLTVFPGDAGYMLESTEEFAGNSHEKITQEVWKR